MMHSTPMPLTVALDIAKRLHHELSKHMTPEQRRDFTRVERLIKEAHEKHKHDARGPHSNGQSHSSRSHPGHHKAVEAGSSRKRHWG